MENPETWSEFERVVDGALRRQREESEQGVVGLSDVRVITDALRDAGLLKGQRKQKKDAPKSLSDESRRLAAVIAHDINRVLDRAGVIRIGLPLRPSKDEELYHIVRKLKAIADGMIVVIEDEG